VTFPQVAVVLALAQGSVRPLEIANDVPPSEIDIADLPSDVASAVGKSSIGDRTAAGRIPARRARRSGCASKPGRWTAACGQSSSGSGCR
jgi:hypothetical protein